jgi:Ca2+-binding RTX toxin-like protein
MATFNLNSTSSQTQNYYTVVGEKFTFPIEMAALFPDNLGSLYDVSQTVIRFGSEAFYSFEDLTGISNVHATSNDETVATNYSTRSGFASVEAVDEITYADGTRLDRVSIFYDTTFGDDYYLEFYGALSFSASNSNPGRATYTFDAVSYEKAYVTDLFKEHPDEEVDNGKDHLDIWGVFTTPFRINLNQFDASTFIYNALVDPLKPVAASLVDAQVYIPSDGFVAPGLSTLGVLDFSSPLESEGILYNFTSANPYRYNSNGGETYNNPSPPTYSNDTVSGSIASIVGFTASQAEQGIDVVKVSLTSNSISNAAFSPSIKSSLNANLSPSVSNIEVTHGYGPVTFNLAKMNVIIDPDTSSVYSANFSDALSLQYISGETPLHDSFSGNDTLNLTSDRHGQTIYAGGGDDIVNAGSGDDIIYGNGGVDTIYAGGGNDRIIANDGFFTAEDEFYVNSGYNITVSEDSYRTNNYSSSANGVTPDHVHGDDGTDTLVLKDYLDYLGDMNSFYIPHWINVTPGYDGTIRVDFRSSWQDFVSAHPEADPLGNYNVYKKNGANDYDIFDTTNSNNDDFYSNEAYVLSNVEFIEINGEQIDLRPYYLAKDGVKNDTLYAFNSQTFNYLYNPAYLNPAVLDVDWYKPFFVGYNGGQYYYVDGGAGNDVIYGTDLAAGSDVSPFINYEYVSGFGYINTYGGPGVFNDNNQNGTLTEGDNVSDVGRSILYMGEILDGGDGNDTLIGGAGNDLYFVNVSGDTVVESTRDAGFDVIVFAPNTSGLTYTLANNASVERLGVNRPIYDAFIGGMTNNEYVNLPSDTDQVNITGGNYTYELIGHDGANIITAGSEAGLIAQPGEAYAPDVILIGLGGNDTLIGGSGEDNFFGGSGNDVMEGGADNDSFYFGLNNLEEMPYTSFGDFSSYDATFSSAIFDEYFFDHPQELTGGHDSASGGEGNNDRVVVVSPLWDQPTFQRTSNDAITLSTAIDSLRVDKTTEFLQNYYNLNEFYTKKILPFVWASPTETYEITPASSVQRAIYATVKKRQVFQRNETVNIPAVLGTRDNPEYEKQIFEKIIAIDDNDDRGFIFVAPSEYNDFIVASSLDDGITYSNDLGLTSYNINGGDGIDMIFASRDSDWIRGGAGQDSLYGTNASFIDQVHDISQLRFDNSDLDGNVITLTNHGLRTGQAVIYDADGGSGVTLGLAAESGTTFYVIVIDAHRISLSEDYAGATANPPEPITISTDGWFMGTQGFIAPTQHTEQSLYGDAGNDTLTVDLSFNYFDISHPNSETITFNPGAVLRDSFSNNGEDYDIRIRYGNLETIDISSIDIGDGSISGNANDFPEGKRFVYFQGTLGRITGLVNEQAYTVKRANENEYYLSNININDETDELELEPVVIGKPSYSPGDSGSTSYILQDSFTHTYEINAHGFNTGDAVEYGNGGSEDIYGLDDGVVYYVIKIDDNNFVLAETREDAFDDLPINALGTVNSPNDPNDRPRGSDHTFTFTPTLPYHFHLEGGEGDDTYRIKSSYNEAYLSTFEINDTIGSNTLVYLWGDAGDPSWVNGVYQDELFFQWDVNQLHAINYQGDLLSSIATGTISRFVYSDNEELFTPVPRYSFNLINPSASDYLDGTIEGTSGDDQFFSINGVRNKFYGAAGNDYIILNGVHGGIASGGLGNNIIQIAATAFLNQPYEESPNHTLSYEWTSLGMTSEVDLTIGFAYVENSSGNIIATDEISRDDINSKKYFTNVTGGNANDTIIGNEYQNILVGGGGNDTIYAGNNTHMAYDFNADSVDSETDIIYIRNHGFENGEVVEISSMSGPGGIGGFSVIFIDRDHFKLFDDLEGIPYVFSGNFFTDPSLSYISSWAIEGGDLLQGGAGDDTLIDDSDFYTNNYFVEFDYIESPILEGGSGNDTYIIQFPGQIIQDYFDDVGIRPTLVRERASDNSDSGGIDTVRLERDNVNRSIWSSEEVNFNIAFEDDPTSNAIEIQPFYADSSDEINFSDDYFTPGPNSAESVFDYEYVEPDGMNSGYYYLDNLYTLTIEDHGLETGDRIRVDYNTYSQPVTIASFSDSYFGDGGPQYNFELTATTTSDQIVDNLYKDKTYYVIKKDDDTFELTDNLGDALYDGYNENYGSDGSSIVIDRDGQLANTAGTFKIIKESVASIDFTANTTLQNNETVYVDFHNQLDFIYGEVVDSLMSERVIGSKDKFYNLSEVNGQHYGLDYLLSNNDYDLDWSSDSLINPLYFTLLQEFGSSLNINSADVWSNTSHAFKDFNEVTYNQSGTTITITGYQNYVVGDLVMLNFSNSSITDGLYKVAALTNDGFRVNTTSSGTSTGTVAFSDHIFDGYDFTWLDENYIAISDTNSEALYEYQLDISYNQNDDGEFVVNESTNNMHAVVDKNALEYIDFASYDDDHALTFKYKVSFDRGTDNVNPEVIMASQFAGSYLFGNAGTDIIFDTGDTDTLLGGKGNDYIQSLSGYDLLNGGEGDDILHFRSQGQIVIGGKGADEFRVSGFEVWATGDVQRELSTPMIDSENLTINFPENVARIKDFNLTQGDSINLSRDFLDNLELGLYDSPASAFDVGITEQNGDYIFYLGESYKTLDAENIFGLFKIESNELDEFQALSIQDELNHQLAEYSLSTFNTASLVNNFTYTYPNFD